MGSKTVHKFKNPYKNKRHPTEKNMKMLTQTVMGTSGKWEPALSYQKRKGLTDNQMYSTFPGLKPSKTK